MVFDLLLIFVCCVSTGILWYRVSQKIPELVAIPDEVIIDRLHEDSARIRVFLLSFRRRWSEREHHQVFLRYAEKALYKSHILVLRLDNGMMALLKKIRTASDGLPLTGQTSQGIPEQRIEDRPIPPVSPSVSSTPVIEIPTYKAPTVIAEENLPPVLRSRTPRMQEVRRKRTSPKNASVVQR